MLAAGNVLCVSLGNRAALHLDSPHTELIVNPRPLTPFSTPVAHLKHLNLSGSPLTSWHQLRCECTSTFALHAAWKHKNTRTRHVERVLVFFFPFAVGLFTCLLHVAVLRR